MKVLMTLVFGAAALLTANFATAAPAAASNVGVYAGSNGFAIQIGHNDRYGYGHRRCWDRWYRYRHPYQCRYRGYSGYNPGYYGHQYYNNYNYRYDRRDHRRDRRDHDRRW